MEKMENSKLMNEICMNLDNPRPYITLKINSKVLFGLRNVRFIKKMNNYYWKRGRMK
jgi:hypothetical protein